MGFWNVVEKLFQSEAVRDLAIDQAKKRGYVTKKTSEQLKKAGNQFFSGNQDVVAEDETYSGTSLPVETSSSSLTIQEKRKYETSDYDPTSELMNLPKLNSPHAVVETFNTLIKVAGEVDKYCEYQKTIRHKITAEKDAYVERLKSTERLLSSYLDKTFDERKYLFDNYFKIIDQSIKNGDSRTLSQCLQNVLDLAQSSPFKALADFDKFDKMLNSGEEFEIL